VEAGTRSAGGAVLFSLTSKESATTSKKPWQSTATTVKATTVKATTSFGEEAIRPVLLRAYYYELDLGYYYELRPRSPPAAARQARQSREEGGQEEAEGRGSSRSLLGEGTRTVKCVSPSKNPSV
jgi:hypothetical protein